MARALPDDGKRYEVLDGELVVSPAPSMTHQEVLYRLSLLIQPFVQRHSIGWTYLSPADIEFSAHRLLQPDLFVVPRTEPKPTSWKEVKSLLLAVETVSPSSARTDRVEKRRIYQSEGVPEYWIVDPDSKLVERWRPEDIRPEVISDAFEWQPLPDVSPLCIELRRVFTG
ncbi:MAG TPA: Uma2 family endonuclease [Gemmatimonadaceae bacterium]